MNIQDMKPGREMDALVAEKVMGFEVHGKFRVLNGTRIHVKQYSTDISAAYEMELKMSESYRLRIAYISRLKDFLLSENGKFDDFDLIHATPHQRSVAALMALEGYHETD